MDPKLPNLIRFGDEVFPSSRQRPDRHRWPQACAAGVALLLGSVATVGVAQEGKQSDFSGTASISGINQFNTGLNGGGNFNWSAGIVQGELTRQFTPQFSAGFSFRYGYESWHFSTPSVLGAAAPWSNINRPAIGLDIDYRAAPDLALFVAPQIEWDYESGANAGNAQNYGAVIAAIRTFSPTQMLGFGVSVFRQIDTTVAFPIMIVRWEIDDKWSVRNPFPAGPAGPAGVELVYTLAPNWELAGGGTFREYRFRLNGDGPTPDGIGRNQGFPLFARLTRKLGPQDRLDFYVGAMAGGQLRVQNSNGGTVASSAYKLAPLLGVTAVVKF
jgi:hypothetical protein